MDEMSCPKCQSPMSTHTHGDSSVSKCPSCGGVFLDRADVGHLVEAENDWHANRNSGFSTAPLPRITEDMTAPPPAHPKARAYIETLFD